MEPTEPDVEAIGHALREALAGACSEDDQIRQARTTFGEEVARRNSTPSFGHSWRVRPRRWLPWTFAASLCAGAAALWFWPRPISFEVGEAHPGRIGDVIASLDARPTPIRFSDGSSLLLHGGGRMRVLSLGTETSRVVVEDGIVDVSIAHPKARKTRWSFEAGAYRVVVTGTKFQLAFRARNQSLGLSTEEGQVVVSGGCQQTPQRVSAGQRIDWSCSAREEPPTPGEGQFEEAAFPATAPEEKPQRNQLSDPVSSLPSRSDLAWRGLLASGRLLEGLHAADRADFQRVCRTATAKELLALADAARLFGSHARAVALLRLVRQRFPGTTDAATAAFGLGLMAFEGEHAYAEATKWFEIYLRDQPSGPLMGDSFGRLMKARALAGDPDGARTVAEQYLRQFPKGPYASDARGILSR
jgi:transmembrane sensor